MVKCQCGQEIVFLGYEMVEISEEGEEMTEYNGSYAQPPPSERHFEKTRMYACKDPFCRYSRKMTFTQLCEYEEEQQENSEIEESFKNRNRSKQTE